MQKQDIFWQVWECALDFVGPVKIHVSNAVEERVGRLGELQRSPSHLVVEGIEPGALLVLHASEFQQGKVNLELLMQLSELPRLIVLGGTQDRDLMVQLINASVLLQVYGDDVSSSALVESMRRHARTMQIDGSVRRAVAHLGAQEIRLQEQSESMGAARQWIDGQRHNVAAAAVSRLMRYWLEANSERLQEDAPQLRSLLRVLVTGREDERYDLKKACETLLAIWSPGTSTETLASSVAEHSALDVVLKIFDLAFEVGSPRFSTSTTQDRAVIRIDGLPRQMESRSEEAWQISQRSLERVGGSLSREEEGESATYVVSLPRAA